MDNVMSNISPILLQSYRIELLHSTPECNYARRHYTIRLVNVNTIGYMAIYIVNIRIFRLTMKVLNLGVDSSG
jgi:hypothetical protein